MEGYEEGYEQLFLSNALFMKVSAKTGDNITEAFETLILDILKQVSRKS